MSDPADRTDPIDDDLETYELAEEPEDSPSRPVLPPGVGGRSSAGDSSTMETDDSHVDPDSAPPAEPEYVNAEVQRMRREDQRRAAAEELAIADAKRLKIILISAAAAVVVLIIAWVVIF